MNLSEFNYYLPPELIAQHPLQKRDQSKMMVVYRNTGEILHRQFKDFPEFITSKDLIVYNNSKVIPARVFGIKKETGAQIEFLFLRETEKNTWECLVKPKKRITIGTKIIFNSIEGEITGLGTGGLATIFFPPSTNVKKLITKYGHMPLPPYIKRNYSKSLFPDEKTDKKRYQTIFASNEGSIACPTAGLHFTKSILNRLKKKHINLASVTLHVGLGTFLPLKEEIIEKNDLHNEFYSLGTESAGKIKRTKKNGGRIIAVGTTTTRVLETAAQKDGLVTPGKGLTGIFIFPGKKIKVVDALLTNFHLPKSSLLLLISAFAKAPVEKSAFAGIKLIKKAYEEAVKNNYRFYSYGDCMLILDR